MAARLVDDVGSPPPQHDPDARLSSGPGQTREEGRLAAVAARRGRSLPVVNRGRRRAASRDVVSRDERTMCSHRSRRHLHSAPVVNYRNENVGELLFPLYFRFNERLAVGKDIRIY